jgi:iron complex outermembrane recepter protein
MRKLLFLSGVLIFCSGLLMAQSGAVLKGVVTDAGSGKALYQADIHLRGTTLGTITGIEGSFTLSGIPAGEQVIVISYLGYEKYYLALQAVDGKTYTIVAGLKPDIISLPSVNVEGEALNYTPYITTTVVKERIDRRAVRDIGDYLRELPNVSAVRKGGANLDPVVRGFRYEQLNVQVNEGIRIEGGCPNRMDPTASHIEVDDLEGIEVLKGPFALRYGPNMGGIINLKTIKAEPYQDFQVHIKAFKGYESNWNGNKEHLTIKGGNQRVFFALSGNRSQYGNYTDGNGVIQRSQFSKFNRSARLGLVPFKNHELQLSYIESFGRTVWFAALPMDERKDNTKIYSFDYKIKNIGEHSSSLDFKIYYADVYHEMDNKERAFSDTSTAVATVLAGKLGYRIEAGLQNVLGGKLYIGTDMENVSKDGDRLKYMVGQFPNPQGMVALKVENLWNDAYMRNYGVFAEFNRTISKYQLSAAIRYDNNSAGSDSIYLTNNANKEILKISADSTQSSFNNLSFSLGLSRPLSKSLTLNLALGRGVRSPGLLERFIIKLPVGYDNYEYVGNPQLKPEVNYEADLTLEYSHKDYGKLEFNAFYSYVQHFITGRIIPGLPLTQTVKGIKEFYNADPVTFTGLEMTYVTPSKYDLGISLVAGLTQATMSKATRHIFDANGNATGTEEVLNDPLAEMPPFESTLAVHYSLLKGALIPQIAYRMVAAQKRVSEAFYESETDGFSVLNFSLMYKMNSHFTVAGGVNNIMNTAYYEHLNRRIIGSNLNIYEPGRVFYANIIFNL